MPHTVEFPALSSGESVRAVALRLMQMSESIHHTLRRLTAASGQAGATTSAFALLTEEYALRARASMLLIEADRLARPGFPASQATVLDILGSVEAALSHSNSSDEMNELIAGLLLFTSSIVSRRNQLIWVLLEHLREAGTEVQGPR